jgi:hypothetical protein
MAGDIDAEIQALEATRDRIGEAEDVARCPACACARPKAREGVEIARISGRIANLRAKQAYDAGDTQGGIALDKLANDFLTNEHRFHKSWASDEMIAVREALDKADAKTDQFRNLRGRPKKRGRNLALAPDPEDPGD